MVVENWNWIDNQWVQIYNRFLDFGAFKGPVWFTIATLIRIISSVPLTAEGHKCFSSILCKWVASTHTRLQELPNILVLKSPKVLGGKQKNAHPEKPTSNANNNGGILLNTKFSWGEGRVFGQPQKGKAAVYYKLISAQTHWHTHTH